MSEDFQLIKRKDIINAENNIAADREAEKKRLEAKAERKEKVEHLQQSTIVDKKQRTYLEFHGNIQIQILYLAQKQQGMQIAMRPKVAVNVMRVQFPLEVIDEINDHIDDTIIPNNVDYSPNLVGQIRQSEKSKQLHFPHEGDEVGEQFSSVLMRLGSEYG